MTADTPRALVRFGAAYYAEYMPHDRLEADLDLMVEAGFTTIRIGESVWSTWEPHDGKFDLEWISPVIDGAHARGIEVILGTPTYAVPPWLMHAHPEIAAERATGVRVPWGARQEAEVGHPVFRAHAERVTRQVVGRWADHPAVIGFQVDNEPGQHLAHNDHVFEEFRSHLSELYPSIDDLNDRWNLTHWSHRLNSIEELWRPDGNHVPQYDLEWRRFQARRVADYIGWQRDIVRDYARPDQFVTTCIDRMPPAADDRLLSAVVDIPAANLYVATQDELGPAPLSTEPDFPPSGAWAPFYLADRAWAMADGPYLVTETNAGTIGHPWFNHPPYDGQWRQLAWAMIARGARGISYWNWHSMHGSWEMYWNGVLPHDLTPGRAFAEIARLGDELEGAAWLGALTPNARVALIVSNDTRWLWDRQPPFPDAASRKGKLGEPDKLAYERTVYRLYAGLERAGLEVRILHAELAETMGPDQLSHDFPVVIAASPVVSTDALAETLERYAHAGGHLVATFRTAYTDATGSPRTTRQPHLLADAAGIHVAEATNLPHPVAVEGLDGDAERISEYVVPTDGQTVARLAHPQFGAYAAVTTRAHGAGRVTYVGCFPSVELSTSIARWIASTTPDAVVDAAWRAAAADAGCALHTATSGAAGTVRILHRLQGEPTSLTAPTPVRDALTGDRLTNIRLGAWDVAVVVDADRNVARR